MKQSTFARKVLATLLANGWVLMGGRTVTQVMDELRDVNDLNVGVRHPEHGKSFLYFVWQGPDDTTENGDEVLADYGMKLDGLLSPLYKV